MTEASSILDQRQWQDWLSPILVKELRQGLREPSFVISFIALQVGLAFLIFIGLGTENDSGAIETQNALFQGALLIMFLLILPLRGLVALSGEKRFNTLETMLLTQISPWGVVFGKWTALVFQGFLLATTVLPYIIIRYLAGGEELVDNVLTDAAIFWGFIVVSAVCVGLSAVSILSRVCCFIGLIIVFFSVADSISSSSSVSFSNPFERILWPLVYMIFVPLLVFEFAATAVSSSHGGSSILRKRLLLLLFLGIITLLQTAFPNLSLFYFGIIFFELCVVMEICQIPELRVRSLAPFKRFRYAGKVASLFFLSGWPSGVLFALIVIPFANALAIIFDPSSSGFDYSMWLCYDIAFFGSIFIPLIIILTFFRKLTFRMFLMTLVNLIWLTNCAILEAVFSGTTIRPLVLLEFFPSLGTLVTADLTKTSPPDPEELIAFFIKGGVVDLFCLGILVLCAVPWMERLNRTWALAKGQIKPGLAETISGA